MAEHHLKLKIWVNKEIEQPIIAKQFDVMSRFLDVTLMQDDGKPYDLRDHKARFHAKKPDGKFIFNDAVITDAKNGKIMVELTDQTLAVPDKIVKADIGIYTRDEKRVLTTRTFRIFVEAMQRDDTAIESTNEYGAILKILQKVVSLYAYIKQDVAKLQTFNFDNLLALDEVKKKTVIGETVVTETITDANMGYKIAERITTFNPDGSISTAVEVFGDFGDGVMKRAYCESTMFQKDGIVEVCEETAEGFNDYRLTASYLANEIISSLSSSYTHPAFPDIANVREALDVALGSLLEIVWKETGG